MNKKSLLKPFTALMTLLSSLFGRIHWQSPPWFRPLQRHARLRPLAFWSITSLFVLIGVGLYCGYSWYQSRPQPDYTQVSISAPNITPLQDPLEPEDLVIEFSKSAAPLKLVGKEVTEGVNLSPETPGEWVWETDKRLVFTPDEDWPAGQLYHVEFKKEALASSSPLATYSYPFATKAFNGKIDDFSFYQDPNNPHVKQIVAIIKFNFPVNVQDLQNKTLLQFAALKDKKHNLPATPLKFTLSYDKFKRIAYLRSENIKLTNIARSVQLLIEKDLPAAQGPGILAKQLQENLLIPDTSNYLQVTAVKAAIIRNEQDRPEQILNVETSLGIDEQSMNNALEVYLLPQNYPASVMQDEQKDYQWQNPGEVTAPILALARPLTWQALPPNRNYSTLHSYKFHSQTPQYLYIRIKKGLSGLGGYRLAKDYQAIVAVPEIPKEISFLHKGALLALSSEKMLSVLVRGVPAVKFEIARVLPENLNQLITQTEGSFSNPYFINESFNQQNISKIFSEVQQFDATDLSKQQYTTLDLASYLAHQANSEGPQGLFLLQATGWDNQQQQPLDVRASRLVLITDLGLIVKDNKDGTHDLFVQSISQGQPVADAKISVLGKNGLAVMTRMTDEQGHVNFPILNDYTEDKEPIAYLAELNSDVSFIPFNNNNRQLNFSRYDTGGIYGNAEENNQLSAFIFTDRGIYRPGDEMHAGIIVKQAFAHAQPAGLPVQITVTDPRGTTIYDNKVSLDESGYLSFDLSTLATSPTGQYQINLYLIKDNRAENLLGNTTFRVAEFLPDRMKISSSFSQMPQNDGWISPQALQARVELMNLYGGAAANRKISSKVLLAPRQVKFSQYPDYTFIDPLIDPDKPAKVFSETLPDTTTDEQGKADIPLNLEQYDKATYQLSFFAEGFEAEGGRSVATQVSALVSPLKKLVGYKPDGDLSYIKQNDQRSVHYLAINPQLQPIEVPNVKIELFSLQPVVTLIKTANGDYQYQSIIQPRLIQSQDFQLSARGTDYLLPTQKTGDFALKIIDNKDEILSQVKFSVVGASQLPLAKNAELDVKLDKKEYKAGDTIELQITAPYTGSGLMTIERDKVYAARWFTTSATSSVQTIRIPADFQGNGYVNVAFVRNWDSPEIFISPLSYAVIPFTVNHDGNAIHIRLTATEHAKPGQELAIGYQSDKPGKIIIFAVDEGILQVAKYLTPDPLAFFFQKRALEVVTQQTLDQILPNFIRERELSAVGGDGGEEALANHLNPFKRKTDLPVVFWSGLIDVDATLQQLTYRIPDYFNGSLRIMAVAATTNDVGSAEKQVKVKGDFVIYPNVPTFVAPGDQFEVSASIANNVKDSGKSAPVLVSIEASPELEIIGEAEQTLAIDENKEAAVKFNLRAKALLGDASIQIKTKTGVASGSMAASLSVRPASSFMTTVDSAATSDKTTTLQLKPTLYPEYRSVEVLASTSPVILITGLQRYLQNYPYGCTEQLVSKVWPLLAMTNQPWFEEEKTSIDDKVIKTVQMLTQRQMSNGAFTYWPGIGENVSNDFASVYAMHFLTEAKEHGYLISPDLMDYGISYLKELAERRYSDFYTARIQAYAIYILTRNEVVTSNYLSNLQTGLEKDHSANWQEDITGAYIAATYQLLQNDEAAGQLIQYYKINNQKGHEGDFYNTTIADAQYLYLIAKHFPSELPSLGKKLVMPLVQAMNADEINTLLSSYVSLALDAYGSINLDSQSLNLIISKVQPDKQIEILAKADKGFVKANLEQGIETLNLLNPNHQTYFYQLIQAGFAKNLPKDRSNGIEVFRDYRDDQDNVVKEVKLGAETEVHIQLRTLDNRYLNNIAVVDLLPGGFEVVRDSIKADTMDYVDIREDRVIFFGSLTADAKEISYRIKATNAGQFVVPPILAESMYDPSIKALSSASNIIVTNSSN